MRGTTTSVDPRINFGGGDPNGIEFEIMWELPLDLYDESDPSNVPLDLEADMARWGADRPGRGAVPGAV